MGLKDRLHAAKRYLTSPLTLAMLEKGSDTRVHVGRPARVVVEVSGQDDDTVERIELMLRRPDAGNVNGGYVDIPLGDVPTTAGRHEVEVVIPPGTNPSAIGFGHYYFRAKLVRTKGVETDAVSPVDVVGRAEDLYWPDSERSGAEGSGDARLEVRLETPTADIGGVVAGTVEVEALAALAAAAVEVEVGAEITALVKPLTGNHLEPRTSYKVAAQQVVAEPQPLGAEQRQVHPFSLVVPPGLPPTLRDGDASVVWQVRARRGASSAWTVVGVLDPQSLSKAAKEQGQTLASLLT